LDLNFFKEFGIRPKVSCTKSDSRYGCEIASSLDCTGPILAGLIPVQSGSAKGKDTVVFLKNQRQKKETFGVPKSIEVLRFLRP